VVVGFAVLILGVGGSYLLQQMKKPPPLKPETDQTKVIDTLHVQNQHIPTSLGVQGELVAFDKIDVFAEVSGILLETSRPFKVGSTFPKGSVLIRVDDEEARLSLLSQKSNLLNAITQMMPDLKVDYPESFQNWSAYLLEFELEGPIKSLPEPLDKQEQYFVAARNIYSQFYTIKSTEERLGKYVLRAPFTGVITQASTNPGALVRVGQKLGELMNTDRYELAVTVPLSDLNYIRRGFKVNLYSDALQKSWSGQVQRINDQVNPGTQTVQVFIDVRGNELREGMYMKGEVLGTEVPSAMQVPKNLLVNQTQLFVVENRTLRLKEVDVVRLTADGAIVQGLSDGEVLLAEPIPGSFSGMPIRFRDQGTAPSASETNPSTISSTR
jgi:multidrug efflux pump subunit AcrA (membrane-fusion protein)